MTATTKYLPRRHRISAKKENDETTTIIIHKTLLATGKTISNYIKYKVRIPMCIILLYYTNRFSIFYNNNNNNIMRSDARPTTVCLLFLHRLYYNIMMTTTMIIIMRSSRREWVRRVIPVKSMYGEGWKTDCCGG